MRRLILALTICLALGAFAAPAMADNDSVARSRIRKLKASVEELETKVVALQLLVSRLTDSNKELETKVDALLQALARRASEAESAQ